MAGASIHESPS